MGSALAANELLAPWFVLEPPAAPKNCPWAFTEQGLLLFDFEIIRRLIIQEVMINEDPTFGTPDLLQFFRNLQMDSWEGNFMKGGFKAISRISRGQPSCRFLAFTPFAERRGELDASHLAEYYPAYPVRETEPTWITTGWLEIIGEQCIPYDPTERRLKCARAYEELKEEIAFWTDYYQQSHSNS